MKGRLQLYSDAGCNVPIEAFHIGKLRKGKTETVNFYLRNEGYVAIENIKLTVTPTHPDLSARILSEDSFKRLGATSVYKGSVEIGASRLVEGGRIDIYVQGVICSI